MHLPYDFFRGNQLTRHFSAKINSLVTENPPYFMHVLAQIHLHHQDLLHPFCRTSQHLLRHRPQGFKHKQRNRDLPISNKL